MTRADHAIRPASDQSAVLYDCHRCFKASGGLFLNRMILCPSCGNKRCPKASDHDLACTGSNDQGQPGSVYA